MELTLDMIFNAYKSILTIPFYHAFLFAVFADVLTGSTKALKQGKYDSKNGSIGLKTHLIVVILVLFICPYLKIMGLGHFAIGILTFYIVNYAVSVLENLEALGVPFPAYLYGMFNRIGQKANEENQFKNDKFDLTNIDQSQYDWSNKATDLRGDKSVSGNK